MQRGRNLEKERLVNFIATIMEDSGFKIKKNYKISDQIIDIYGLLETSVGDVGVVVACKNYEEPWKIGLDVLKEMEFAKKATHASKIIIFTTSSYTHGAALYAQKRNIKLIDRKGLIKIAKNYAKKRTIVTEPTVDEDDYDPYDYYEPGKVKPASLNPHQNNKRSLFSKRKHENTRNTYYRSSNTRNYLNNGRNYLNQGSSTIRNNFSVDTSSALSFFSEHTIVYMLLLIVISTIISYILTNLTAGPYTGIGKIATNAIVCYCGLLLINKNLSDVLFKGSIIFFISIIISIVMLTV